MVIGPQVFTYYSHTLGQIIRKHSIQYHIYAVDIQLFLTFHPNLPGDSTCALFRLACCVKELQAWMVDNRLIMNPYKTDFFIASSAAHYKRLEHLTFIFDDVEINSSPFVKKKTFELFLTLIMKMHDHVTQLSRTSTESDGSWIFNSCHNFVRSPILSRLDSCGALLNGISQKDITRLQRIQNRCARLIFKKKQTHSFLPSS